MVTAGIMAFEMMFIPARQNLQVGEELPINNALPGLLANNLSWHVEGKWPGRLNGPGARLVAATPGKLRLQLRLFDIITLRQLIVNVLPSVKVIPGGQSIGVLLHAQGVIVVGQAPVIDQDGNKVNPSEQAGIHQGDIILSINGRPVAGDRYTREEIDRLGSTGESIMLEVKHGDRVFKTRIEPILCPDTGRYRIGLFIRDSAAGVGTLTFYHPETRCYGALGHLITDATTSRRIDLADGRIVAATVKGIHRGQKGRPGEKLGQFSANNYLSGNIEKNSLYGIFGHLNHPPGGGYYSRPIPLALGHQVKRGPAEILTVLHDNKVEQFRIEIQEVMPQGRQEGKGMVIKITDPRLLNLTGGIIQGMSGSPIIQAGKLVGAVTHVFINDPSRGYGVLAEWMLEEAGIHSFFKIDVHAAEAAPAEADHTRANVFSK
jgi:stage IV sporulation protein B